MAEAAREAWLARAWRRFFAPQPLHAMVILRIALGAAVFFSCAVKFRDLQRLFGPAGLGGSELARLPIQALRRSGGHELLLWPLESGPPEVTTLLFVAMMLSALAFALGAMTRSSGIALLILHAMFYERNNFAYAGVWASMYKPLLFCTLLAPAGRVLSVDAWRRRRREGASVDDWLCNAIPVRMLQLHVCALYAIAGWARLADPGWQRGEMVFAALTDDWFGRFDVDWYPWLPLLRVLSHAAFVLEPLAPFMLFVRGVGKWWALALIGLHVSLELLTNLGWWQLQMVAALTVFLPARWLAPLLGQRPRRPRVELRAPA